MSDQNQTTRKGFVYHDPAFQYTDQYSGRTIERLTDYLGHTNHLYFTDPCWIEDNRSMVVTSDRNNRSNLFRLELEDRVLTQLTDLKSGERPHSSYSSATRCHYYISDGALIELSIDTLEARETYRPDPATAKPGMKISGRPCATSDGSHIIIGLSEPDPTAADRVSFAYANFHKDFHRKPLTRIVRVHRETGAAEIIHEDRCFISHLNPSPALPHVMTFCHEGPWNLVDQRIWGLNITTGDTWKIRDQSDGDLAIGHEYWFADGERIGYHGRSRSGSAQSQGQHIYGHIRWDGSECVERWFPFHSTHFHSLDEQLIVGDGSPVALFTHHGVSQPFIQLFRWNGGEYEGPRILAYHRSTFNDQHAHPHPRFTPDGRHIIYTSDLTAYSNIYRVGIGDFDELPLLTDDVRPQHT
ncbi:MAG: oligogalacturonate lyase family protein [Spirochaetaceae bacterium]